MAIINYEREYQITIGQLGIKITYSNESSENTLSCDVIKDIDLNYGYEDQDELLYFYPNTVKLAFEDFDKKNYFLLKHSLDRMYKPDNPIYNRPLFGGIEIHLNGILKLKGYIDPLTLHYNNSLRTLEFEGVCMSALLKDIRLTRHLHYLDYNGTLPENASVECTRLLYGIFKQIWIDFPYYGLYHYLNEIDYSTGIFVKHDWLFKGIKDNVTPNIITKDWSSVQDFAYTVFNFDSMGFFGPNRLADTCHDVIRQIALEFGAIIGVEDYGKIFFIKRFGQNHNDAIELNESIIKYEIYAHLDSISGVLIKNHWNGEWQYETGLITRNENNEIVNQSDVLTYDTNIGSYSHSQITGSCISVFNPTNQQFYPVMNGICDPQIDINNFEFIERIIGKWTFNHRKTIKQRTEVKLYGIDYRMSNIYRLKYDKENYVFFRPMSMTKKLMKNQTKMTGLEI